MRSPSKKALQSNIETEMNANPSPKDRKQNLAIAYSVQRQNKKANGGMMKCAHGGRAMCNMGCYAEGGEAMEMKAEPMSDMEQDQEPMSMSDAIMHKRSMKKMAQGGVVEDNYMEAPADHGMKYNEEALKKELYDEDEIKDLSYGSDMDGPSSMEAMEEEDPTEEGMDHISKIRMRMKSRPLSKM